MNEAEQTSRLNTMSMKELHALKARLDRQISDTAWSIDRLELDIKRFPVFAARYEALNSKRRARMATKTRRLQQVERRIAEVEAKEAAR
jgi:hypothetical protein